MTIRARRVLGVILQNSNNSDNSQNEKSENEICENKFEKEENYEENYEENESKSPISYGCFSFSSEEESVFDD